VLHRCATEPCWGGTAVIIERSTPIETPAAAAAAGGARVRVPMVEAGISMLHRAAPSLARTSFAPLVVVAAAAVRAGRCHHQQESTCRLSPWVSLGSSGSGGSGSGWGVASEAAAMLQLQSPPSRHVTTHVHSFSTTLQRRMPGMEGGEHLDVLHDRRRSVL
jgi:hypothetical protein